MCARAARVLFRTPRFPQVRQSGWRKSEVLYFLRATSGGPLLLAPRDHDRLRSKRQSIEGPPSDREAAGQGLKEAAGLTRSDCSGLAPFPRADVTGTTSRRSSKEAVIAGRGS